MPAKPETESSIPDVPESECWITYARSSGPGGQNVNKRSTKAVVRWHVEGSPTYTDEQKRLIAESLKISKEGYITVDADAERSRERNRENAIKTLREMVREALTPEEERVPTKPTEASDRQRLTNKKKRGDIKRERQKRYGEDD